METPFLVAINSRETRDERSDYYSAILVHSNLNRVLTGG